MVFGSKLKLEKIDLGGSRFLCIAGIPIFMNHYICNANPKNNIIIKMCITESKHPQTDGNMFSIKEQRIMQVLSKLNMS